MSDSQNSERFTVLKTALESLQTNVKQNRTHIEELTNTVIEHDKRTALTGQKVNSITESLTRVEHKIDMLTDSATKTKMNVQEARNGLKKTDLKLSTVADLVTRHDEQLTEKNSYSYKMFMFIGAAAGLIFLGYYLDNVAMDSTIQAIKGLF